jgi:hypothetical protein
MTRKSGSASSSSLTEHGLAITGVHLRSDRFGCGLLMASLKDKLMAANEAGVYTDEEARQRALDAVQRNATY